VGLKLRLRISTNRREARRVLLRLSITAFKGGLGFPFWDGTKISD